MDWLPGTHLCKLYKMESIDLLLHDLEHLRWQQLSNLQKVQKHTFTFVGLKYPNNIHFSYVSSVLISFREFECQLSIGIQNSKITFIVIKLFVVTFCIISAIQCKILRICCPPTSVVKTQNTSIPIHSFFYHVQDLLSNASWAWCFSA